MADFLSQARAGLTLPLIPVAPMAKLSEITFEGLPPGIHITQNRDFQTGTELLQKLFSLSQASGKRFRQF